MKVLESIIGSADTLYDQALDMEEVYRARYLAISPCQACYSFSSSLCRCGKYLYCDILCQVRRQNGWFNLREKATKVKIFQNISINPSNISNQLFNAFG